MTRARRHVEVAVVISDASPILTLARLGRLDLLSMFDCPIHLVDQVAYEVTKPENDPNGSVAEALRRLGNRLTRVETATGVGFREMRARDASFPSKDLGEQAVHEHVVRLVRTTGPSFVPLVLFEDPDITAMRAFGDKRIHFLNTTGWLLALYREGLLPEGQELIGAINATRKSELVPFERGARTKKIRSKWLPRRKSDA